MSSQVNGNINKQRRRRRQSTTNDTPKPTTIQNQSLSKSDDQPNASRLPSDQGSCSPTNHGLHLGYTCFPLPANETETEQICKYPGAGPRPARVVTSPPLRQKPT